MQRGAPVRRGLLAEAAALPRSCRPLLAFGAAVGAALAAAREEPLGAVLALASYGAWSAWLCASDVRERRLPNTVLLGALCTSILPLAALRASTAGDQRAGLALGVAGAVALCGGALWAIAPGGLGAGDAKLAPLAAAGAVLGGAEAALLRFALALCAGLLIAGAATRLRGRATFALGPVLLAASWTALLPAG